MNSVWHHVPLAPKSTQVIDSTNILLIPGIQGIDIELLLMKSEYELDTLQIEFTLLDNENNPFKSIKKEFKSDMKIKYSDLFPDENNEERILLINHKGKIKNYITFCYLFNGAVLDGGHTHYYGNECRQIGNARKFMHFPKISEFSETKISIQNAQDIHYSFKLRIILDSGEELVRCFSNHNNQPILHYSIIEIFPEFNNLSYDTGVIMLESYDFNLHGEVFTISKTKKGEILIATDHLTGA